ncbi:MAG: dTDP-4-dehydrorhamnose 3,5-epimerase [Saccharofermentanales bacterium]|jgi:dTDP-4-dehydrorhamnose 3,5-epimerase
MKITATSLEGVIILEPKVFGDNRGWFSESYSRRTLLDNGINIEFIQDNHSFSAIKGTLRGLHFQNEPEAQSKLVRCTRGRILDVAVDIRNGSPTYRKWIAAELSDENHRQLLIPKGFAHAFLTLTDNVEVQYKVDAYYSPENDRSIRFDDPEIGIDWGGEVTPILSEKDLKAPLLRDCDCSFKYGDYRTQLC